MTWDPVDIAWMAGIFEGEGWISVRKGRKGATVAVRMVDEDVIRKLAAISDMGTVREEGPTVTGKPQFCWAVSYGSDIVRFLTAILPHLSERRTAQANAAFANLEGMRDIGRQGKTHCVRGHSDWVQRKQGDGWRRICRICRRADALRRVEPQPNDEIRHGTYAGYGSEVRRGLVPCEACSEAKRTYTREYARKQRAKPVEAPAMGV